MRVKIRMAAMVALATLGGCHAPSVDAVEENAIVAERDARDAANGRADNLDRLADDLDARAPTAASVGGAMHNEAAEDRAEARAVRALGDADADRIETVAETSAATPR